MPLYEYQCEECGLTFEVRQKFSDAPIDRCRECGGKARKLISQTAFTLKGGGWYQEGYTSGKSCPAATGDSVSKETKTDKPATKSGGDACASCPKVVNG
jgi:putative FmdB family regulatory protein